MSVCIVTTGGTIASVDSEDSKAKPELSASDLVQTVPELNQVSDITTHAFSNIPSTQFTIERLIELVRRLEDISRSSETTGIVVTQGTDVLEETAFFIDLCYQGSVPVVLTGAMRPPNTTSPDGARNLLSSVRVATEFDTAHVLVAFNDRVHLPTRITKAHTTNVDAFRSPEFGPVATIEENRIFNPGILPVRNTFNIVGEAPIPSVHSLIVTLDMQPSQISASLDPDAVCLGTTGAGHIPPKIIEPLKSLVEKGVPIVATTRCSEGRLSRNTYGFRGSEQTLQEIGSYYSPYNLPKTRIKTIVAMLSENLEEAFDQP